MSHNDDRKKDRWGSITKKMWFIKGADNNDLKISNKDGERVYLTDVMYCMIKHSSTFNKNYYIHVGYLVDLLYKNVVRHCYILYTPLAIIHTFFSADIR